MCHNNSIHRQNIWCFFEKIKIMLILSLLRKYDDASNIEKASAWRMVSQIVTLSGLTRLKSIPQMEYIALPYNTRASTLWTSFGGRILGCQREPHSTTALQLASN